MFLPKFESLNTFLLKSISPLAFLGSAFLTPFANKLNTPFAAVVIPKSSASCSHASVSTASSHFFTLLAEEFNISPRCLSADCTKSSAEFESNDDLLFGILFKFLNLIV